jgi:hypothetical protein
VVVSVGLGDADRLQIVLDALVHVVGHKRQANLCTLNAVHQRTLPPTWLVAGLAVLTGLLICVVPAMAQISSGAVNFATVYSPSGAFYLKVVPYDSEYPSIWGRTTIYRAKDDSEVYRIPRPLLVWSEAINRVFRR